MQYLAGNGRKTPFENISPFTLRSTISEPLEPNSEKSSATPLVLQRSLSFVSKFNKCIIRRCRREKNVDYHTDESTNNYENFKLQSITEGQIKSDNSIIDKQKNIEAFLRGLETINYFSPFPLRSNISEPPKRSSQSPSTSPLVQSSKYLFYDNNGKKFIIDNADFEEEKELINIFNSKSTLLHIKPNAEFFENRSYNDACHFYPISTNASSENINAEDVNENIVEYQTDKEVKEITVNHHTNEEKKENTLRIAMQIKTRMKKPPIII
ncbi:hypothetical protein TNCT_3341 [Trichonephila clavata]|uniref:Uncharacterized protein n=1 Tax=Trichonephila clavata TaxID=2740835 RepID=A0A8X6F5L1_TRICU|nr:hypothetical protein TNCT_3341 [Trichonephila clavata]